jgi:hypothetical protein
MINLFLSAYINSSNLSQNAIFFAKFFGENIFKIITLVPGIEKQVLVSAEPGPEREVRQELL